MNKKQAGFGVVEVSLIILVIGLLGFLAVRFIGSQADKKQNDSNPSISADERATVDEPDTAAAKWTLATSGQGGFSIRIPDGWAVDNFQAANDIRGNQITFRPGTPAEVTSHPGSYSGDGSVRFNVIQFASTDNFNMLDGDEKSEEFEAGDVKGMRYYKKYPAEVPQGLGPVPGSERYVYEFKTDNKVTYVTYSIWHYNEHSAKMIPGLTEGDKNQVSLADRAAKTLKIN